MRFELIAITSLVVVISMVAADLSLADDASDGDAAFHKGDYATAAKLLTPLAEKGNVIAELDMGLMYFAGHGFSQDRVEAAKWFLASARQGNAGAETDIGIAYATGEGVPKGYVQAYVWFSLAASQGAAYGAKYRDHVAAEMTPDQVQLAQSLTKQCEASGPRNCGTQ